jgi:elongation factor Ts
MIDGKSVADHLSEAIGKIRENIQLGPVVRLVGGTIGAYLHHDHAKAALVVLSSTDNGKQEIANKLGTQIVALSPEFINKEQIDASRLHKEIEINKQLALDAGKSAEIAEKIAEGKVKKEFLQEVVLLEQPWYADTSKRVAEVIDEIAKGVEIIRFVRLEAGKDPVESRV